MSVQNMAWLASDFSSWCFLKYVEPSAHSAILHFYNRCMAASVGIFCTSLAVILPGKRNLFDWWFGSLTVKKKKHSGGICWLYVSAHKWSHLKLFTDHDMNISCPWCGLAQTKLTKHSRTSAAWLPRGSFSGVLSQRSSVILTDIPASTCAPAKNDLHSWSYMQPQSFKN